MPGSFSKMNDNVKKNKSALGSIVFRAWLAFLVLALCVIAFFWTGELVIFATNYTKMYVERLTAQSKELAGSLRTNQYSADATAFRSKAEDCARRDNLTTIVFVFPDGSDELNPYEAQIEYYTNPIYASGETPSDFPAARGVIEQGYLERMSDMEGEGSFVMRAERRGSPLTVIYGEKMLTDDGEELFLYTSTTVSEYDFTINILTNQMIIVTIICLVFSIIISFFIAWQFSKPIRQFTATAKKIGGGDVTLKYAGNGYNEFDELADALNYATSEMVKAEKFRRDFLTNVSHDIRTPLTLIKANAEMIKDISGDNKEKRERNTRTIINEADRLTQLVEDILDLSKLEAGVVEMKTELVCLSTVAEDVITQFDVLRDRDGYIFEKDIQPDVYVRCDAKRLTQAIYNLVGNAVNYAGDDRKVIITVREDNGKVRVEVTDHGKGIPEEEIEHVWERYYRSNQNKRNVVGSGIGLSIVKSVLISFGAEYGIESGEGKGSTFWFMLASEPRDKR